MGRLKLTPWFDGSVDPVRAGWYDANTHDGLPRRRRYWDGAWRMVPGGPIFTKGVDSWRGEGQPRKGATVDDERLD